MKLLSFDITNFRGLAKIDAELKQPLSVVVGPNAIGKTSILEAIRATKAVLAPRVHNEPDITLTEMGAVQNQRLVYEALAGDVGQDIDIILTIELSPHEVAILQRDSPRIVMMRVRDMLGVPTHQPDYTMAQYMSSEQGRAALKKATQDVQNKLVQLPNQSKLKLHLTISNSGHTLSGHDLFAQEFISALESSLEPATTLLSYFPADRALPTGEINVQIGAGDIAAKLHSHLAQPGTKYTRLKNIIVHEILMGETAAKELREDFHAIFEGLLVGKQLKGLSLNKHGSVSVLIEEKQSGKTYDLDRMSSGEKGLILQFLLLRHSLAEGGVVLIDEPELHLNPAVCKRLIPFFIEHVIKPRNVQAILCTHSAEILATAFERQDCQLFHLRSSKDLSPVYKADKAEVFEALKRLGAGTSDVLFSKGTLFVEGVHDAEILEAGFPSLVGSLKIMPLHGRPEIEKEIRTLQKAEQDGHLAEPQYFIFDRDRSPTKLVSSPLVRIQQWQRYCFENYLLDSEAIFDACKDSNATAPPESRGTLKTFLKELAMSQLNGIVARRAYATLEPENCGVRPSEIDGLASYQAIAECLVARLEKVKLQLAVVAREMWMQDMNRMCDEIHTELLPKWEEEWQSECDGKRVLHSVFQKFGVKGSPLEFKKRVIRRMGQVPTETWRAVDNILGALLSKT